MKKYIAIVTNNDDDIYCFRKELIETLINKGHDMFISCPYGPKFELMKDIKFKYDNPFIDRRGTNVLNDIKLLWHYIKLFYREKPDVVLTYTAKPNVYASIAAGLLHIPYINNVTGLGSVINKSSFMKTIIMNLFRYAYNGSSCVMFQNECNMKKMVEEKIVTGRYRLIPGSGVALERYPVQPYPDGGDGIQGEKVIFNYIGRILYDKGIDKYIEAAKVIRKKYPLTEFNIIGFIEPTEIHYKKELEILEKNGIIIYRGSQQDVRPFIKRAHAIVHPSIYGEGMSNVLLENASSGRPIITTDNAGCKETVLDNISGYIYTGSCVEELIEKIELFLSKSNIDRYKMGILGRKYIEEKFSRDVVISAYIEEIERI